MPFCHLQLYAAKPLPRSYPQVLRTIGDHLRKRRLDLGLLQRQIAEGIGIDTSTLTNWELNRTEPEIRFLPGIFRFLGFDPRPAPESLAERLVACRTGRGLSRVAAARLLGVDPATLWRWESGRRLPGRAYLERVEAFLAIQGGKLATTPARVPANSSHSGRRHH